MRTWGWMLGGLIVWSIHFLGVYLISSVADVVATADDLRWRMAGVVFSAVCILVTCGLLWTSLRRLQVEPARFADQLAALGAATAVVAIAWQTLPTLVGF